MIRDVDRLTGRSFDVLVVGGGIHGLAIAYDAAHRGLSTALVERNDFGSGASFNHLRTIHGGLRYLQSLDFRRARESVRERRTLARIAPHALRPVPFALPIYRSLARGKIAMRGGFLVDRVVGAGRNRGVPGPLRLRGGRVYSRGTAIQSFPGLKRRGLVGAAVWHDYITLEPDRLTFSWALAAHEHGTVLVNHVEGVRLLKQSSQVAGIRARDIVSGREFDITAHVTVNATGGALDRLLRPAGLESGVPMLKAMNLVTKRDAGDEALGGRSPSGRNLFMVPWRDQAIFGTWESNRTCEPDDATVDESEIAEFMAELNHAFPALDLVRPDITLVHLGLVPAVVRAGKATPSPHEQIRDHARDGVEGLISVAGTKYTTARAVAERTTNLLLKKLRRPPAPCTTASTVLPGGSVRDVGLIIAEARREHDEGLPTDTIPHLIAAYGSRYRDVLEVADARPELKKRVAPKSPVIGAQLVVAVRSEMAVTLADALIRRTPAGSLGYPGDDAVARAADIIGAEAGWGAERKAREIEDIKRFYR